MKLTRKNASKLYDGLCALLGIDSLFIDHNSVLHASNNDTDNDEDEEHILYSLPGEAYIELYDSKIWKDYDSQLEWSINYVISIDSFAYHMRCDPDDVKYQVMKAVLHEFDADDGCLMIEVAGKRYTINNLEELKVKADLKT